MHFRKFDWRCASGHDSDPTPDGSSIHLEELFSMSMSGAGGLPSYESYDNPETMNSVSLVSDLGVCDSFSL